jgi:PhnB protein
MSIHAATPYLILNGKADQAVALYKRALGATVETLQRFGDVDKSCPAALKDRVMHAVLRAGNATFMASDGSPEDQRAAGAGHVSVALDLDDPAEARESFEALAASGKAIQPLIDAPWGALFGVVEDEFGVSWMFNCAKKPG